MYQYILSGVNIMIPYSNYFVENYHTYYEDIADRNLKSLRLITTLGFLMGIPLILISLFLESFLNATIPYIIISAASVFLNILAKTYLKAHKRLIPAALYTMAAIILGVSVYLGTIMQPELNAVTFIVFLVGLPLFIVDIPSRICMFMGIFCVIFCIFSKIYKTPYTASYDIINTVVFYLLSIFTSHQFNYLNFQQIMSNNILEIQRDTDKLTGLWNRGFCERKITSHLSRPNAQGALLVIDIDNFKLVNDSGGHDCGDQVLKEVGAVLQETFRSSDIIGRIGGDEFLIFLPDCSSDDVPRGRIVQFLEAINAINTAADRELPQIGASIGIALSPADGTTFRELFKHADEALYLSKQNGKNQYAFYHILT